MRLSRRVIFPALAGASLVGGAQAQTSSPMTLKLVVLDIGGTLIADHGEVPDAMLGAFARHGVIVSPEDFSQWRGASKREMVRHFLTRDGRDAALLEPIYADFTATVTKAYEKVAPIPGAENTLKQLAAMTLLLATTTGFDRPLCDAILARLDLRHYFTATVTSDEVADGRPAPYMLFKAMELARVQDVRSVLAVGDTPLDLQAAANAGVGAAIGVWSGATTQSRLRQEPNTAVLPSVAALPDFIRHGLPQAQCR